MAAGSMCPRVRWRPALAGRRAKKAPEEKILKNFFVSDGKVSVSRSRAARQGAMMASPECRGDVMFKFA